MAFFDNHRVFSVGTTQITVALGATNAALVEVIAGQVDVTVRQLSGSTLSVVGTSEGTTLTAAQMVTLAATAFPISGLTNNAYSFNGPTRFYLQASGNTAVVAALLYGKSAGA